MKKYLLLLIVAFFMGCSHDFDSNTLDLGFYQWNFWTDEEAAWSDDEAAWTDEEEIVEHPPTCGWEVLHRGNGKLVRIPARVGEHFSRDYAGVVWFHVRFTLPEVWAGTNIALEFEGVSGKAEIYLNERLEGIHKEAGKPFSLDLTERIFYTRDNHLAIRITDPSPGSAGVLGKIALKSSPTGDKSPDSPAS